MQKQLLVLSLVLAGTLAACGGDDATTTPPPASKILNFSATLTGAGESPNPVNTPGSGTFTATLDTSTSVFTWNATFSGLTSNISNGHIHGPFTPGASGTAPVILNFDPAVTAGATFTGFKTATSGSTTGSVNLKTFPGSATVNGDSLRKLIIAGAVYVNIHTTTNGGGEIRGQLTRVP